MSGMFNISKQTMFGAGAVRLDLNSDVIKVGLLAIGAGGDYTYDPTATTMSGITRYAGTTDQPLGSATVVTNTPTVAFDAAAAVFTAVSVSGTKPVGGLIVYKFTTDDPHSMPILYVDGFAPITPNGGNVTVQWDNGPNRIVSI